MHRFIFITFALVGAALSTGCGGPSVTTNPAPVEVTFQVSRAGRPVNDLSLNLQPIASGTESSGVITKGTATLSVTPGTYTYYVSQGKSEATYEDVPEPFRSGSMDRSLVIDTAKTVDLKLD
jgi:hypothetical protein